MSCHPPLIVQAPGWGPSGLYLERTLGPLLAAWEPHFYAVRNTPGGPRVDDARAQATEHLVRDLDDQRRGLGADRVVVVGHSHGAFVALGYAIRHPARVAALLLLGPSVVPPGSTPGSAALLDHFRDDPGRTSSVEWWEQKAANRRSATDDRDLARDLRRSAPLNFYSLEALARFQHSLRDLPPPSVRALHRMPGSPENWVRDGLHGVTAPVLCLTGRHDFLTPPDAAYGVYAALAEARLHVIDRAGHNAWVERPVAVGAALRRFLADIG